MQVELVGKHIEVAAVEEATLHAAVVLVTNAIELGGVTDGQGAQQYGVNQGEDGSLAPMPKARVTVTTNENPGLLRSWRSA